MRALAAAAGGGPRRPSGARRRGRLRRQGRALRQPRLPRATSSAWSTELGVRRRGALRSAAGPTCPRCCARSTCTSCRRGDEPFGLVTVESMALGTPPLVGADGAGPELVQDGVSGSRGRARATPRPGRQRSRELLDDRRAAGRPGGGAAGRGRRFGRCRAGARDAGHLRAGRAARRSGTVRAGRGGRAMAELIAAAGRRAARPGRARRRLGGCWSSAAAAPSSSAGC